MQSQHVSEHWTWKYKSAIARLREKIARKRSEIEEKAVIIEQYRQDGKVTKSRKKHFGRREGVKETGDQLGGFITFEMNRAPFFPSVPSFKCLLSIFGSCWAVGVLWRTKCR